MNTAAVSGFSPYIAKNHFCGDLVFDFYIADAVAKSWYGSANQMMIERQWCKEHIRPGFQILDCGAHHGMTTLLFARWCSPGGHVISVEAFPENSKVVGRNMELNGIDNVEIHTAALSNQPGYLEFHLNQGNVMCKQESAFAADGSGPVLRADTIDCIVAGRRVDFLKVDVEGSDLEALQGALATLRQRPLFVLELHCFAFRDRRQTVRDIFALLSGLNYNYQIQLSADREIQTEVCTPIGVSGSDWFESLVGAENPHVYCVPAR